MRLVKVVLGWTLIVIGISGLAQVFRGDLFGVGIGLVLVLAGLQLKQQPKPGHSHLLLPDPSDLPHQHPSLPLDHTTLASHLFCEHGGELSNSTHAMRQRHEVLHTPAPPEA